MKKLVIVSIMLLLSIAVTGTQVFSAAYLSANGGLLWSSDSNLSVQGHESRGEHKYDLGYVIDIAIGNSYESGLRGELEVPYRFNDIDKFTMTGANPKEFDREISKTFSVIPIVELLKAYCFRFQITRSG